ncbi:MAG: hypothetical protein QM704_25115 [Anaeromyxobacteraceae bacterium]
MGKVALVLAAVLLVGPGLATLARGVGTLRGRPLVVQGRSYRRGPWVTLGGVGLLAWGGLMIAFGAALLWVAAGRPGGG